MSIPTVYLDDADAYVGWEVTDGEGQTLDWADPEIAIGAGDFLSAAWQGDPASTREIRLPMPLGLDLDPGTHTAYLKVPNGTDFQLGKVKVANRS